MSPALFTNTVRNAMMKLKGKWEAKSYGCVVGSNCLGKDRIAYAMFADDTTLIAKSKQALSIMMRDIRDELAKIGLNLNAEKCSVQCVGRRAFPKQKTKLGEEEYPITDCTAGFKVLGVMITMDGRTSTEFEARLRAGWAKFSSLSELLTKKDTSVTKRLKLFDATVSKTILWCSESWKLTVAQKRKLRSVQRSMLRRMVGPGRRPDEDYISWIRRATRTADHRAREAGVACWTESFLRSKWRWAGKIANMSPERWAKKTTDWRNHDWWSNQSRGTLTCPTRSRPGRFVRWEDDIVSFGKDKGWASWSEMAKLPETWQTFEDEYVKYTWR